MLATVAICQDDLVGVAASTGFEFQEAPFPVACLTPAGQLISSNRAWVEVAAQSGLAWDALALAGPDRDDFSDVVRTVIHDRVAVWVDVDVPVLAEKRWARCHMWPFDGSENLVVAVIPLREARDTGLTTLELDHIEGILEHTADAIAIVREDLSLGFASGIASRFLGMSGTEYEGKNALSFVFSDDHHLMIESFAACVDNPRKSLKARFRMVHESGDLIWVEAIGTNMFDDPIVQGILVSLNDITELVETRATAEANELALGLEKQRYETLAQFTPTGVFELDDSNIVTFSNERFDQLMGLTEEQTGQSFPWEMFDERDRGALISAFKQAKDGAKTTSTVRLTRRDRSGPPQRWLTIRAVSQDNRRLLGSVEDATTQITRQAELEHRADHDDLTGLPNRENLLERLREFTAAGEKIGVLFLDLDNFKDINDALGHQVGDQVLVEIAQRIRSVVRPSDIVGRLHGDEFLIVCRRTNNIDTAHEIAGRVVEAVAKPLTTTAQQLVVSGSVGIAMSQETDATAEQLLVETEDHRRMLIDASEVLSVIEKKSAEKQSKNKKKKK